MTAIPDSKARHILLLVVLLGTAATLTRLAAQPGALALGSLPVSRGPASGALGGPAPAEAPLDIAAIDAYASEQVRRHGVPGLALAVVEGDRIIFMQGYGRADASGRPVTPQTPFLLASVSKPLTAVALMQLVEAGRVELDAPVQRYVPDFRLADPAASGQITVRHLLLHTSGLPNTACDTRANAQTLAAYVAELETVQLSAPAGTRHLYCSGNYNLLGRIIETVTGQAFGSYVQQHVFAPLEMRQSFTQEEDARRAGLAQGHQWLFGLRLATHHPYNPSQLPSGYLLSSAEDLGRFLVSQLNGGRYGATQLLSAETIADMQAPGVERGAGGGYGFGWVIAPVGGVPAVWHDGVNVNYHTLLLMQPETQRGVVVLMNAFGIVAYESGFKETEAGLARLLAGLEPLPASGLSLGALYVVVDAVLVAVLAIALWPLLRLRQWQAGWVRRQPAGRLALARVCLRGLSEIGLALTFLTGIRLVLVPGLGGQSWSEVLTAFPDFVLWIWALGLAGLATGVSRLAVIWRVRRGAGQPEASPAVARSAGLTVH